MGNMTARGAQKNKPKQTQFYLAPSTAVGLKTNLKKQSQFASGQIGVKSYLKGVYGNIAAWEARKNKAKQSQFCRSGFWVVRTASGFPPSRE